MADYASFQRALAAAIEGYNRPREASAEPKHIYWCEYPHHECICPRGYPEEDS